MSKDWLDEAIDRAVDKVVRKHSFPGHAGRPGQEGGSAPRGGGGGEKKKGKSESYGAYMISPNVERAVGVHKNGKPKQSYDILYKGQKIGLLETYDSYKDTKPQGQVYVTSRKDVTKWIIRLDAGHYDPNNPAGPTGSFLDLPDKKYAMDMLDRFYHKAK